jgi:eukaryotic-like serine/threonine-protein kinase
VALSPGARLGPYEVVSALGAGGMGEVYKARVTSLQWRDHDGATTGSAIAPAVYRSPRLSSDQTRALVTKWDPETGQSDIWMLRLALGNEQRQTFDLLNDWFPVWSPDDSQIFFGSSRNGAATKIFRRAEQDEPITGIEGDDSFAQYPNDTSSDGKFLSYTQSSQSGYDVRVAPLTVEAKTIPVLASPANEVQARFAPNGRWLAYASDESGKFEVYVRPFPEASGQTLISVAGGMQPEWRRDGKELFYISADRKLMAVPVITDGTTFSNGAPRALFDVQMPEPSPPYPTDYAVGMDGQRFLVNTVVDQPTRPALTVIVNWTAELKK